MSNYIKEKGKKLEAIVENSSTSVKWNKQNKNLPTKRSNKVKVLLFNFLGVFFTLVGIGGVVLPVLPSTVFFILASGFFIHSNPILYRWLHNSKITGAYLRVYTTGVGLSLQSKAWTIGLLWTSLAISSWFVRTNIVVLGILALVGVGVSWHVATIRPRKISAEKLALHREMMNPVSAEAEKDSQESANLRA
jgi:uncharacterized membrane protein YbaN (DUF454 family)